MGLMARESRQLVFGYDTAMEVEVESVDCRQLSVPTAPPHAPSFNKANSREQTRGNSKIRRRMDQFYVMLVERGGVTGARNGGRNHNQAVAYRNLDKTMESEFSRSKRLSQISRKLIWSKIGKRHTATDWTS